MTPERAKCRCDFTFHFPLLFLISPKIPFILLISFLPQECALSPPGDCLEWAVLRGGSGRSCIAVALLEHPSFLTHYIALVHGFSLCGIFARKTVLCFVLWPFSIS